MICIYYISVLSAAFGSVHKLLKKEEIRLSDVIILIITSVISPVGLYRLLDHNKVLYRRKK